MSKITIEQAVSGFREEAAPLVATCEWKQIRKIFAHWTAKARTSTSEEQIEVLTEMKKTLQELLHAPSRKVTRNFFSDL